MTSSYLKWAKFYRDELDMFIAPVQKPMLSSEKKVLPTLNGKDKYYKVMPVGYKERYHGKDDYLRDVSDEEISEWEKEKFGIAVITRGYSTHYKKYQRIFDIDNFGSLTKEQFWKKYSGALAGNFVTESYKGYHVFVFSDTEITITNFTIETPLGDTFTGELRYGTKSGHTVEPPSLSVDDDKWIIRGEYSVANFCLGMDCGELPRGWVVTNASANKTEQKQTDANVSVDTIRNMLEGKTVKGKGQGVYDMNLRYIGVVVEKIKEDIDEVEKALKKVLLYNSKHSLGYTEDAVRDTFFSILKKEVKKKKMDKVEVDMETIRRAGGTIVQDESDGMVYIQIDGKHNHPLKSAKARRWIVNAIEPKDTAQVTNLIMRLDAAIEKKVRLRYRVAQNSDNAILYDIGDDIGSVVTIGKDKWECGLSPDICLFKPSSGGKRQVLPLPDAPSDDVWQVFDLINIAEDMRPLFLCAMIYYFIPNIQYPLISFFGEKGSGKSTAASILRNIIDPNEAEFDSIDNKKIEDARVALSSCHLSVIDNLSNISQEVSDMLCLFSTGGAYRKRALYTDGDTHLSQIIKPLILTSVSQEIKREDLLSRTLLIEVCPLVSVKSPSAIKKEFGEKLPKILGGIFTVLSRINPASEPGNDLVRMSDFHIYSRAICTVLGVPQGVIDALLRENFIQQETEALQNSDTGEALQSFMIGRSEYEATATEWVATLGEKDPSIRKKHPVWFARDVRRLVTTFRTLGISIDFPENDAKTRKIRLRRVYDDGESPDDFHKF